MNFMVENSGGHSEVATFGPPSAKRHSGATATEAMRTGERLSSPSWSGQSPAAKRVLMHFEVKIKSLVNGFKCSHLRTYLYPIPFL